MSPVQPCEVQRNHLSAAAFISYLCAIAACELCPGRRMSLQRFPCTTPLPLLPGILELFLVSWPECFQRAHFHSRQQAKQLLLITSFFFPLTPVYLFFPLEGTPSPPMQKPKENYFFLLAVFFMGFPILIRNWPASRVGDCPCKHLCLP